MHQMIDHAAFLWPRTGQPLQLFIEVIAIAQPKPIRILSVEDQPVFSGTAHDHRFAARYATIRWERGLIIGPGHTIASLPPIEDPHHPKRILARG